MRTYIDCYPCFIKQALEICRHTDISSRIQREIVCKIGESFRDFPADASPPEMAIIVQDIIKSHTGLEDPYFQIKKKSTRFALSHYDELSQRAGSATDPLRMAVLIAILGNLLDYGVFSPNGSGAEEMFKTRLAGLEAMMNSYRPSSGEPHPFFREKEFRSAIENSQSLLYIGDNAGEAVFDRILIETIKNINPELKIYFGVRSKPALNDALLEDARESGLDQVAEIVESGSGAAGTILSQCSNEFITLFNSADMVVAKGQGNYETLSDAPRKIFLLLVAKCEVLAGDIGCTQGEVVLAQRPF
jgi:damage-control phosphatase, subfamily I